MPREGRFQAAQPVGQVHQQLGALPRLRIFKGYVVHILPLADVAEMNAYRVCNVHALQGDAKLFSQGHGIALCPGGGSKTGHGHRNNIFPASAKGIHGPHSHQQRQGGVKPTGNAKHRRFTAGVCQPLFQPGGLKGQNRLTPFSQVFPSAGTKGDFATGRVRRVSSTGREKGTTV